MLTHGGFLQNKTNFYGILSNIPGGTPREGVTIPFKFRPGEAGIETRAFTCRPDYQRVRISLAGLHFMLPHIHNDAEGCVEAVLSQVGRKIVLAMPIAIGKPNHFVNALYRRAVRDQFDLAHDIHGAQLREAHAQGRSRTPLRRAARPQRTPAIPRSRIRRSAPARPTPAQHRSARFLLSGGRLPEQSAGPAGLHEPQLHLCHSSTRRRLA